MSRQLKLLLLWALTSVFAFASEEPTTSKHQFSDQERAQGYANGRLVLVLKDGASHSEAAAAEVARGISTSQTFDQVPKVRSVTVPSTKSLAQAKAELEATGLYASVGYDRILKASAVPNDTYFSYQWHLNNTGAVASTITGTAGADISAEKAWGIRSDASSVVVAIIDSGITLTHPDLVANLWTNSGETAGDNKDNDGNGYIDDVHGINTLGTVGTSGRGNPTDDNGHGTHVAGIIGAVGNNGVGTCGVAWKVQLMALKFLDSSGEGSTTDSIACISYAIAKSAKILNCSYGTTGTNSFDSSEYAAFDSARQAGIIVCAAAGNDGVLVDYSPTYPSAYPLDNLVSVGNSDYNDAAASSSNYSQGCVDLFAPGTYIYSTYPASTYYTYMTGTSMASPVVAGAMALVKAQFPSDTYRQTINRVLRNVDKISGLSSLCSSGGRLNLYAALNNSDTTPLNDSFANRIVLAKVNNVVRGSNGGGSRETGEPVHGVVTGTSSVWWEINPTDSGTVTLDWASTRLSVGVGVYTGTSVSALTKVAANTSTSQTSLSFSVTAGTSYKIAFDSASSGAVAFKITEPPTNDNFESATVVSGRSLKQAGSNLAATAQTNDPSINNIKGGLTVWYKWTAPSSGSFQVSAGSTSFIPDLGIYTGSSLSSLTQVTSATAGSYYSAVATFTATSGTTYYFCVDSNDGSSAGDFVLTVVDSLWQFQTATGASNAISVDNSGTIYVGDTEDSSYYGRVYAINADGSQKWKRTTYQGMDNAGIAIDDSGYLYFTAYNAYVYSVDASNTQRWKKTMTDYMDSSVAIGSDGTVYVKSYYGTFYALNGSTGAINWSKSLGSSYSYAAPVIGSDGTIYIGDGNGTFWALSSTGSTKWTYTADDAIYSTAAIDASGNLYFASYSGTIYSLSSSGSLRWKVSTGKAISSSPAINASGVLYIAGYDKLLHALKISDGSSVWTCTLGDEVHFSSPTLASDGSIYIGAQDGLMYEVSSSGSITKSWATANYVRSTAALYNGRLYFSSDDGKVYAVTVNKSIDTTAPWPTRSYDILRQGRANVHWPVISSQVSGSSGTTALLGYSYTLSVSATGSNLSYQWYKDGVAISGATSSTYTISSVTSSAAGTYVVVVSNGYGTISSSSYVVTTATAVPGRIMNMSVRAVSASQGNPLIIGFVNSGNTSGKPKPLLIRGIGPSLSTVSTVSGTLADPVLLLYSSAGTLVTTNDNWGGDSTLSAAMSRLGAFSLSSSSLDSALLVGSSTTAATDLMTAWIYDKSNGSGIALAEVYDADSTSGSAPASGHLVNISARAAVGTGDNVVIAGFVISGNVPMKVLIRGVGPSLVNAGLSSGYITDPQITLYQGSTAYASNDDWGGDTSISTAASNVGAFAYTSTTSKDAALLLTLVPGVYTAILSGSNSTTGTGLIEVYQVSQ